jgi:hypothetical protein
MILGGDVSSGLLQAHKITMGIREINNSENSFFIGMEAAMLQFRPVVYR